MDKRIPTLTVDGRPVPHLSPFNWPLMGGVTAPEIQWILDPETAAWVLTKREVTIDFTASDGTRLTIRRAVVVGELPSGSFFTRTVVLSDVRWYWRFVSLFRAFNVRARTGKLTLAGTGDDVRTKLRQPEFAFRLYSLRDNGQPFKASELIDILLKASNAESKIQYRFAAEPRNNLIPNNVELDDRADQAIARALALTGGLDVRVELDGTVTVYERTLGAEIDTVQKALTYDLDSGGKFRWLDLRNARPRRIRVRFTREMEVRLDYIESSVGNAFVTQERESPLDTPFLETVVPIVDAELTVNGEREPYGTYLEATKWINSVAALKDQPDGAIPLSLSYLQSFYLGPLPMMVYAGGATSMVPSQVWARRIGAFMENYRITYRINRRFMSRVVPGTLTPVRSAIVNNQTGARDPSPVFMDYCCRPTLRWIQKQRNAKLGWNFDGWPWDERGGQAPISQTGSKSYASNPTIDQLTRSPATVNILDSETGIFQVELKRDLWDLTDVLVPSRAQTLPVVDPTQVNGVAAAATMVWENAGILPTHRCVVIVSAVPAGTNDERALFEIDVLPGNAVIKLNPLASRSLSRCLAPPMDQRVWPALVTARFEWEDAKKDAILSAFGVGKTDVSHTLRPTNLTELRDLAFSVAASVYASLLDHYEGAQTIALRPDVVPIGSIHTVVHQVDQTGRMMTTLNADARVPPMQAETFLTASSRRILLREMQ